MEELLSPAALQPFLPFFLRLGHNDLDRLLALDDEALEWALDEVESESAASGVPMRGGHRNHILTRVRQERIKMQSEQKRANRAAAEAQLMAASMHKLHSPTGAAGSITVAGVSASPNAAAGLDVPQLPASDRVVFAEGLRGLLRHWLCCLGVSLVLICASVAFLVLYQQLGSDPDRRGVNGDSVGSASEGGWKFVYVLSILGFVFAGGALMLSLIAFVRNPQNRSCNCARVCSMPNWRDCSCRGLLSSLCSCESCSSACGGCCDGCCDSCGDSCGGCFERCGLGSCGAAIAACFAAMSESLRSCWSSIRESCALSGLDCCPDVECGGCECGECDDCCGLRSCAAECGCGSCDDCTQCCRECEMPNCDCDCWSVQHTARAKSQLSMAHTPVLTFPSLFLVSCLCLFSPDCEGDISNCCGTLYKICCCQCKIQVA